MKKKKWKITFSLPYRIHKSSTRCCHNSSGCRSSRRATARMMETSPDSHNKFFHFSEDDLWFMAASLFFSPLSQFMQWKKVNTHSWAHTQHTLENHKKWYQLKLYTLHNFRLPRERENENCSVHLGGSNNYICEFPLQVFISFCSAFSIIAILFNAVLSEGMFLSDINDFNWELLATQAQQSTVEAWTMCVWWKKRVFNYVISFSPTRVEKNINIQKKT